MSAREIIRINTRLFRTIISISRKRERKEKKHARGTNLLDLPPCTETVVTCSRPPKSTIARYPPFPLVSYVKTVFVRANDRERRLIHPPRFGREMDGLVSRREADQAVLENLSLGQICLSSVTTDTRERRGARNTVCFRVRVGCRSRRKLSRSRLGAD